MCAPIGSLRPGPAPLLGGEGERGLHRHRRPLRRHCHGGAGQPGDPPFVRVGTCGGIRLDVRSGDVVVATGAVRMEGPAGSTPPSSTPLSLISRWPARWCRPARRWGSPWYAGVVQCKDSFYGQHDPARMPVSGELEAKWGGMEAAGGCWPQRWSLRLCSPWQRPGECGAALCST